MDDRLYLLCQCLETTKQQADERCPNCEKATNETSINAFEKNITNLEERKLEYMTKIYNEESKRKDIVARQCESPTVHVENGTCIELKFSTSDFPRFEYHSELVQNILDCLKAADDHATTALKPERPEPTVLVSGSRTDEGLKLFTPTMQAKISDRPKTDLGNRYSIVIFFHGANTPISKDEQLLINKCYWCIFVTGVPEVCAHIKRNGRLSVVSYEPNALWDNLTSALEMSLIDFLEESKKMANSTFDESVLKDIDITIARMQRCSAFSSLRGKYTSKRLPREIKSVLKRFKEHISRYGFHREVFRVVVTGHKEKIEKDLKGTAPGDFFAIEVISIEDFMENLKPFMGELQGRKIYPVIGSQQYGTLGCVALLNGERTVALSCMHVFLENDTMYIEDDLRRRILVGKCLCNRDCDALKIQGDLAIVSITKDIEEKITRKMLMNHRNIPTKAVIYDAEENFDLVGEIVHKIGAKTQWTQGKIVSFEIVANTHGIIAVEGMQCQEFGKDGDSGAIVFRESFSTRERKLDVVAVLTGGIEYKPRVNPSKELQDNQQEKQEDSRINLTACSLIKSAFECLKKSNPSFESISFYNE